ncbi:MAG TPA: 2-succinyl-5-enolpyruvyl-6-hydroxy-3-cyclohexene-1-carboxylic-acid synthase [Opitutaceae bacterium]|nr:2-succinyl-5-enolpyruvyl-6-hydroxy-3-cyclohexene-1-carboxylic-acid synthase [Opitutaceae bacterium]
MSTPEDSLDFRNVNALWGSVLVETLVRLGVTHAVISPGSRSAPLTVAFARHARMESIPVLDERSAAFFALGLAKQRQRPVALVCTSGTAAANFLPAIVEARESGVPLIVLTADRPPEMRDCHSGQTIDQVKLYGGYVNFFHEFAVPEASLALLRYLRQTLVQAHGRALRSPAGPVHLNCPFRDPLPPVAQALPAGIGPDAFRGFFSALGEPGGTEERYGLAPDGLRWPGPAPAEAGIIVVGPCDPEMPRGFAAQVARISRALGWPVLADALSPVRQFASESGHVVAHYDPILRSAELAAALRPKRVICIGGWPTSKVLRAWLQESDPEAVVVSESRDNLDALHLRCGHVRAGLAAWSAAFAGARRLPGYARRWLAAEKEMRRRLARTWHALDSLVEPGWVPVLAKNLPKRTGIFVASSMPVRDLEYFWPAGDRHHFVKFNRGANGIDGTLSTALGVAHGARPTVLVTGDLALLHDSNGFLVGPKLRGSLTILLINNDGGGIFGHLPIAQFDPPFEEFFATPQRVDFARLCAAHGVAHARVRSWADLGRLVARPPSQGIRVLELRTDRKKDAAWRKSLFADLAR